MKRTLIALAMAAMACATLKAESKTESKAASDTTLVRNYNTLVWGTETFVTKAGEKKTEYYAAVDGKVYSTNKTSADRGRKAQRFGAKPVIAVVTSSKGKQKVITL